MGPQLPLSVQLADAASFDNFHAGSNTAAFAASKALASGKSSASFLIYGPAGCGRSHLLQSIVRVASTRASVAYLPLSRAGIAAPEVLDGLESVDLLALDDFDLAMTDRTWSLAALRMLDARRSIGAATVVALSVAPERLPSDALPDLRTRLDAIARYPLKPLEDDELCALMQTRAHRRGLELPNEVAEFLVRRLPRSIPALIAALDALDVAALSAQRRLTIPFVQLVLPVLQPARGPQAARTAPG